MANMQSDSPCTGGPHAKIRVAIVFGGQSAEHEISILSARNVLQALDRTRFEPLLIGIDKNGRWWEQDEQRLLASSNNPQMARIEAGVPARVEWPLLLGIPPGAIPPAPGDAPRMVGESLSANGNPSSAHVTSPSDSPPFDVVFPVLHGTLGEDGCIQGLFEVRGIPYVGAGVLGSAVGMDKDVMKRLLRDAGIPVADFRTVREPAFAADPKGICDALAALGFPLFTKPANAGSSVGIRRVSSAATLESAVRYAFEFDSKMLAEAAIPGREIELAVLGGHPPSVSEPGEIVVEHPDGFYSYDAKYLDEHGARLEIPASLSPQQRDQAQALALQAFEALECEGMARVDCFLRADGEFFVNEINTLPGFTAVSMYPKLWAHSGVSPTDLVSRLIDLALVRSGQKKKIRRSLGF